MPLGIGTKKPDPAKIYIAWQPFAVDGVHTSIHRGDRLRGDHPAVVKAFGYFVEDGVPEIEWPSVYRGAIEASAKLAAEQQADRARNAVPEIPLEDAVDAVATFTHKGRNVTPGQRFRNDDPLVRELVAAGHSDWFQRPPRPLP